MFKMCEFEDCTDFDQHLKRLFVCFCICGVRSFIEIQFYLNVCVRECMRVREREHKTHICVMVFDGNSFLILVFQIAK